METFEEVLLREAAIFYKGTNLQSEHFRYGDIPVVAGGRSYAGFHNISNVEAPCITVSASGAYAGFVQSHSVPIMATDCIVIQQKNNHDLKYIYYALSNLQKEIYDKQTGGAQPHIYIKDIDRLVVPFPKDRREESIIATALSDIDALIEAKSTLLEKKRAIKRGVMQELLTGRHRLSGFPVTSKKQTDIGEIPEDWEVKRLGEIGVVRMCKRIFKHETTAEGDIPFFKIGTFGRVPDAYITKEKFNAYKSLYPYPQIGTPLISTAGTIGRVVVYDGKDAYYQDSNIVWLEHDQTNVRNTYLKYHFEVIKWTTEKGSTIARLYNNNILSSQIALPPLKEQESISSVLVDMDIEIETLDAEISKLAAIRNGMMSELLTGHIRLVK